jgi:DNA-directed RNA polymerase subunit RPC12/RpoP
MKEGYSKLFKDSSCSKDSSGLGSKEKKKKGNKCTYCNKPNHEE